MATRLISFIFTFSFLILPTISDPRAKIIARKCSTTHENNISIFFNNFLNSMKSVSDQISVLGFGNDSSGEPPNQIYVMGQCLGDLSQTDCTACFSIIRALLSPCFPSSGGRVYLDGCFLRAENYMFYNETISSLDMKVCGSTHNKWVNFGDTIRQAIAASINEVSSNKAYVGEGVEDSEKGAVFALANCWRSLDRDACTSCLAAAVESAISCLPSTEGRVLNAGCVLRYSDKDFINDTNFQLRAHLLLAMVLYVTAVTSTCISAIVLGVVMSKTLHKRINKQNGDVEGVDMESSMMMRCLRFDYPTIRKATDSFSESHRLGQGGFGEVFKGSLADGREVAIKRLYINAKSRGKEACNEMNVISRAEHKNLVRLLGCCLSSPDILLVYEFLPNGSLDKVLFDPDKKKELDWKKRLGIIIGTAQGLEYLHKDCEVKIIHRDIKASNILLDLKFRPKIADFGQARFFSDGISQVSTALAGTFGYMAPEYIAHGQLTEKADTYSYGILILEIISGISNTKFMPDQPTADTLVTSTWKHFQLNSLSKVIDESMEVDEIEEVTRVVQVGLLCTQESPSLRPSMTTIIQMLRQKELQIPKPSKPPFLDEAMEFSLTTSDSPDAPLQQSSSSSLSYSDRESR